jgi:hypothetical protein
MDSRAFARAHDAYLDPDRYFGHQESPPRPHCSSCGAFLRRLPDRHEPFEEGIDCDGTETIHEQPYSDQAIAILGEEFRDIMQRVSTSACGIEIGPHAPHREITWAGTTLYRTCRRCGTEHKEAE